MLVMLMRLCSTRPSLVQSTLVSTHHWSGARQSQTNRLWPWRRQRSHPLPLSPLRRLNPLSSPVLDSRHVIGLTVSRVDGTCTRLPDAGHPSSRHENPNPVADHANGGRQPSYRTPKAPIHQTCLCSSRTTVAGLDCGAPRVRRMKA